MQPTNKLFTVVTAIIIFCFLTMPVLAAEKTASAKKAEQIEGKLNINTADVKQLKMLPGVGKKTAENIIAYRSQQGNFKSSAELGKVKGVGKKTLEKIKDYIVLDGESTLKKVKK